MKHTTHTPGPWNCILTSHHYYDYRLEGPNGQLAFDTGQAYKNARLIAQAPRMLEALELWERYMNISSAADEDSGEAALEIAHSKVQAIKAMNVILNEVRK